MTTAFQLLHEIDQGMEKSGMTAFRALVRSTARRGSILQRLQAANPGSLRGQAKNVSVTMPWGNNFREMTMRDAMNSVYHTGRRAEGTARGSLERRNMARWVKGVRNGEYTPDLDALQLPVNVPKGQFSGKAYTVHGRAPRPAQGALQQPIVSGELVPYAAPALNGMRNATPSSVGAWFGDAMPTANGARSAIPGRMRNVTPRKVPPDTHGPWFGGMAPRDAALMLGGGAAIGLAGSAAHDYYQDKTRTASIPSTIMNTPQSYFNQRQPGFDQRPYLM